MKITIWQISGYKGWSDYDGVADNNFVFKIAIDSRFAKEEVEEIFFNRYSKKHRTVALTATFIEEKEL